MVHFNKHFDIVRLKGSPKTLFISLVRVQNSSPLQEFLTQESAISLPIKKKGAGDNQAITNR